MIRLLVLVLCLWGVCLMHAPYRHHQVAKAVTGQELMNEGGNFVQVTGVLTDVQARPDGSTVLKLDCQGLAVMVFADPTHKPGIPLIGTSLQVCGSRLGPGALALRDATDLKPIKPLADFAALRQSVYVERVAVLGPTRNQKSRWVRFIDTDLGVARNGLVREVYADQLKAVQPTQLIGYHRPDGVLMIDTWR